MLNNLIKALKAFLDESKPKPDSEETKDPDVKEYPKGFVVTKTFCQGQYTLQAFGSAKYLSLWKLERSQYDNEMVLRLVPFEWAIVRELLDQALPSVGKERIRELFTNAFYRLVKRFNPGINPKETIRRWWEWLIT